MKNQLMQLQILLTFVDPELANYLGLWPSVLLSVRVLIGISLPLDSIVMFSLMMWLDYGVLRSKVKVRAGQGHSRLLRSNLVNTISHERLEQSG